MRVQAHWALALELRWPEESEEPRQMAVQRRALCLRDALHDLGSDVVRWHYLRHNDGGEHLRVRVWCPGPEALERSAERWANCAPDTREVNYRPEVHKFGGSRCMPWYEALFQASSERALRVTLSGHSVALVTACADLHFLLGQLVSDIHQRRQAQTAMRQYARTRWQGQVLAAERAAAALAPLLLSANCSSLSATLPAWTAGLPADLLQTAPPHDRLAATLQVLHLHANRLGLTLDQEALAYLAVVNYLEQPLHNPLL